VYGVVCRDGRDGRDPEVLVLICAAVVFGEDLEARFVDGRAEDLLESLVERRFDFDGRVEEVDVRGVEFEEEAGSE
jgi:hypothetical protein